MVGLNQVAAHGASAWLGFASLLTKALAGKLVRAVETWKWAAYERSGQIKGSLISVRKCVVGILIQSCSGTVRPWLVTSQAFLTCTKAFLAYRKAFLVLM